MMNYLEKKKKAMLNYVSGITPPLPSAYQQVEWIESTGTQYINTQFYLGADSGFEIKFLTNNNLGGSGFGCILGGRNSARNRDYQLSTYSSSTTYKGIVRWGGYSEANANITLNTEQECSLTEKAFTDCQGVVTTLSTNTQTSTYPAYLFGLNNGGSFAQSGNGCRIYYCKVYEGTTLERDFVPCYRKADDVIGMYDIVNDTFYTNAGSGTFTKGNDV